VWTLDPANSGDLLEELRPHSRRRQLEVLRVGEGWRPLVAECHRRLVAAFPDYELSAIKQKYGVLDYQAFPQPWADGQQTWTSQDYLDLLAITGDFRERSQAICEWCGSAGQLREWRTLMLTLCADCDDHFPDPPEPVSHAMRHD
jgi:hypothetical protein